MFAIVGQQSSEAVTFNGVQTQTISFPPGTVHAQVALFHVAIYDPELTHCKSFISGFTHRPVPDGADQFVDTSQPGQVGPPSVVGIVERMTSVTWGVKSATVPVAGATPSFVHGRIDIFWWADVSPEEDEDRAAGERTIQLGEGLAAVVHDKLGGQIHHVHEEIALPGVEPPDPDGLQRRALALARSEEEGDRGDVTTLVVPGRELRTERRLRVDVKRRRLIDLR